MAAIVRDVQIMVICMPVPSAGGVIAIINSALQFASAAAPITRILRNDALSTREQCLGLPSVPMFDSVAWATYDGRQRMWLGWLSSPTGRARQLRAAVS
jgi:hypothetical protein